jgi:UPF0148 protein
MSEGGMKNMAELLRKGAKMLGDSCPECSTPLFQLKSGEIICPICQRPVIYVEKDQDVEEAAQQSSLETTLSKKINEVQNMLEKEKDIHKIKELSETLMILLKTKEQVKT